MSKWRPSRGRKGKTSELSRARQIGCIVWLVLAMALVMWLFYAVFAAR
jgi:hypothetical protein